MIRRWMPLVGVVLIAVVVAGMVYANSTTSPDTEGDVGRYTSLALDAAGNPVVSYQDADNGDLKLLHCNDPACLGGDESITSPDIGGIVGEDTALVLDAAGNPVIAYSDSMGKDLLLMHCNDPNCAGDDESITAPDMDGDVGQYKSLALDAAGNPVIAYYDATNGDLKVMHCNDPNCADDDESITRPDTAGDVGTDTSLVLDANGYPVIAYFDFDNDTLKVMHCNDPNCAGGNESITTPDPSPGVGGYTSIALDAAGNPVISYFDWNNGTLKVMHCNDPNCAGNDESITSPEPATGVGIYSSLALAANGNPVIAYHDLGEGDLKLMICNDPNCAGEDETIFSPDSAGDVGSYLSLALDANGAPAVSYYDVTNGDLKLFRCTNAQCEPNAAPAANAGPDQSARVGQTVTFNGTASDPDGDPLDITWDFGDGATAQGTLAPQHVYGAPGHYTVTLTVTDVGGLTASDTLTVTVTEAEEGDEQLYLPFFRG